MPFKTGLFGERIDGDLAAHLDKLYEWYEADFADVLVNGKPVPYNHYLTSVVFTVATTLEEQWTTARRRYDLKSLKRANAAVDNAEGPEQGRIAIYKLFDLLVDRTPAETMVRMLIDIRAAARQNKEQTFR
jgi:hypothetical protein